jgi:hypothetical protein
MGADVDDRSRSTNAKPPSRTTYVHDHDHDERAIRGLDDRLQPRRR